MDKPVVLLPCPFCGGPAEHIHVYAGEEIIGCADRCAVRPCLSRENYEWAATDWNRRDGRTVVVPRISEAEAREAFIQWARGAYEERQCATDPQGVFYNRDVAVRWGAYLAGLRHYGILLPTGEKGT